MKINFKHLSSNEIRDILAGLKAPSYAHRQIIDWIYRKSARSFDEMTDISKQLRTQLKSIAFISNLTLMKKRVSRDGTRKFLFGLEDGESIESVLMPHSTGQDRCTLCISSQAGCALGCKFCATGSLGFKRNLLAHEIIDQVISVKRSIAGDRNPDRRNDVKRGRSQKSPLITNIVFMGMGEPLNNLNEVVEALRRLTGYMNFSKRKITVSTAGVVPGMKALAETGLDISLAVSLNAPTDTVRSRIMPINRKYPLKTLMQACRDFPLPPRRRITFEYVLLDGVNDSEEDARRLVALLKGIRSKINLIAYNSSFRASGEPSPPFNTPDDERVLSFQQVLKRAHMTAIIRRSMGSDIAAACGQLKAAYK
jgi:23S rRNA (adenine2503-C2)-methyltransferase